MKSFINYLRGAYRRLADRFDLMGMLLFLIGTLVLTLIISILYPAADEDLVWAGCCVGGLIVRSFAKPSREPFKVRTVSRPRGYGDNFIVGPRD